MSHEPPSGDHAGHPRASGKGDAELRARRLNTAGLVLLALWAVPILLSLLVAGAVLLSSLSPGGGGPGFSGSAAAMGAGILFSGLAAICGLASITLLPLGLTLRIAARIVRQDRPLRPFISACAAVLLVIAGLASFGFQISTPQSVPLFHFALTAVFLTGASVVFRRINSTTGVISSAILIVLLGALTAIEWRVEHQRLAARRDLETAAGVQVHNLGVAFTPHGHIVALGTDERGRFALALWDFESGRLLTKLSLPGHHVPAYPPQWGVSPDGERIAVAAKDREQGILLFDLDAQQGELHPRPKIPIQQELRALQMGRGNVCAAVNHEGEVVVWKPDGNRVAWRLAESISEAALAFAPDGERLAVSYSAHGSKPRLELWTVNDTAPKLLWELEPPQPIETLNAKRDGARLFAVTQLTSASSNVELLSIDFETGDITYRKQLAEPLQASTGGGVREASTTCIFSTHGAQMMVVRAMTLELWDLENGERQRVLPLGPQAISTGGPRVSFQAWGFDVDRLRLVAFASRRVPRYPASPAAREFGSGLWRMQIPATDQSTPPTWLTRPTN